MRTITLTIILLALSACATGPICNQADPTERAQCEEWFKQDRQLRFEREFGRNK